ncbi:MAG: hypothetical protein KJ579_01025, partial [Verrucomicrobia bacterium]|nr:hypothetical protein [Verrucomicrobiota bacterium]
GGEWFSIVAITSDGDATNNVTLNGVAESGAVEKILYLYDLAAAPAGQVLPKGIYLAETAAVNATSELCLIEAGEFEGF